MSQTVISSIPLRKITTSHNPRNPAKNLSIHLAEEGYEGWRFLDIIHQLALSEDSEQQKEFVRLLEKYEWKNKNDEIDPESIVALAGSIAHRQIQPIMVRRFTSCEPGMGHIEKYGLIVGERRTIASAYNHAKHGTPPQVMGSIVRMTVAEAADLAWAENRFRLPPTLLETAQHFHDKWVAVKGSHNPNRGRKWSMKDVAAQEGEDYQEFRRMEALVHLSDADKRRLENGSIGKIKAQDIAMQIKQGKKSVSSIPDKKQARRRVMPLREVETLFDMTVRNNEVGNEEIQRVYLQALADVMQISLEDAIRESDFRRESVQN